MELIKKDKYITKKEAIELMGVSQTAFETRTYRHKVKKVRRGLYLRKDIDFLLTIKSRSIKNTIEIFKPVYITTTYHIYESKMNYLTEL